MTNADNRVRWLWVVPALALLLSGPVMPLWSDQGGENRPAADRTGGAAGGGSTGGSPDMEYVSDEEVQRKLAAAREVQAAPTLRLSGIANSTFFALASGLASIFGAILSLFPTQVGRIPFSLHRSLAWRRVLLLAIGGGAFVAALVGLYLQSHPPSFRPFTLLYLWLHGQGEIGRFEGTNVWAALTLPATIFLVWGLSYDPLRKVRKVLQRERTALLMARDLELTRIVGRRNVEDLTRTEALDYSEARRYFERVQQHMIYELLGSPRTWSYSDRPFRGWDLESPESQQ